MPEQRITTELCRQAEDAVRRAEQRARNFYRLELPPAVIDFSLRGRCAGQAKVDRAGRTWLRINSQLLAENHDDFLNQTIPHEVAHLVVNWQARSRTRRPRPHGPEWQAVMEDCFGLVAQRCHSYPTTPARVVPRPFVYACNCREHRLTSIMHKRLVRSTRAFCKACRTTLSFVGKENPRHDGGRQIG